MTGTHKEKLMSIVAYLLRVAPNLESKIMDDGNFVESLIDKAEIEESNLLDLGESWAAIHYMLTIEVPTTRPAAHEMGIEWWDDSLENVLMGGENTPYECAFENARYIQQSDVSLMAKQLSLVTLEKFASNYDPEYMEEIGIPPGGWLQDVQTIAWITNKFIALKSFYQQASDNGEGILIYFL